ncbi:MAG: type II toxin-antitoxin system VapC family toxin [Bryobacteraceae bacterium]
MIVLDTSVLIDALTGPRRSLAGLRGAIERSERILIPSLVLFEWLRGPRTVQQLKAQESLFPADSAIPFDVHEAATGARLYRAVRRPRGREIDLAIAAYAIVRQSPLWTLNASDFRDIPELRLWPIG